jgi:acetyltransferase-like isoleucine patch superfamily enzyme
MEGALIEKKTGIIEKKIELLLPDFFRLIIKRLYWAVKRRRHKFLYIKKGMRAELGYRFRFSRIEPYMAYIGNQTILEESNIWNANVGDIIVGNNCWFGLHNIVMGPVEIGDFFSSGPFVSILGPRHPTLDRKAIKKEKTIIGNNVIITTGSIILFGVEIGDGAIIGPGSVVIKNVPEGAFVSGNPARDLTKIVGKLWKMDNLVQERFR